MRTSSAVFTMFLKKPPNISLVLFLLTLSCRVKRQEKRFYGPNWTLSRHKLTPVWHTDKILLLLCFRHGIKTVVDINSSMFWNVLLFFNFTGTTSHVHIPKWLTYPYLWSSTIIWAGLSRMWLEEVCVLSCIPTASLKRKSKPHMYPHPTVWNILTFPIPVLPLPSCMLAQQIAAEQEVSWGESCAYSALPGPRNSSAGYSHPDHTQGRSGSFCPCWRPDGKRASEGRFRAPERSS